MILFIQIIWKIYHAELKQSRGNYVLSTAYVQPNQLSTVHTLYYIAYEFYASEFLNSIFLKFYDLSFGISNISFQLEI